MFQTSWNSGFKHFSSPTQPTLGTPLNFQFAAPVTQRCLSPATHLTSWSVFLWADSNSPGLSGTFELSLPTSTTGNAVELKHSVYSLLAIPELLNFGPSPCTSPTWSICVPFWPTQSQNDDAETRARCEKKNSRAGRALSGFVIACLFCLLATSQFKRETRNIRMRRPTI